MASTISKVSRGSGRGLLLLALLFAVVAAVLAFVALNRGGDNKNEAAADTTKVVVAAHDISARTTLKSDMLKTIDVPVDSAIQNGFSSPDPLIGQITRYPMVENEQVSATKVGASSDTTDQGLSFVVPAGMRAFAITVSEESGVGGLILPGDLVDIMAIFDAGTVGTDKAVTLLQSIEILAVAQKAQEPIPPGASQTATPVPSGTLGERPSDVKPNPGARTVTLAVTQEQAQLLALVQARGDLALSLRSYGDRAPVSPPETNLTQYGAIAGTPTR